VLAAQQKTHHPGVGRAFLCSACRLSRSARKERSRGTSRSFAAKKLHVYSSRRSVLRDNTVKHAGSTLEQRKHALEPRSRGALEGAFHLAAVKCDPRGRVSEGWKLPTSLDTAPWMPHVLSYIPVRMPSAPLRRACPC
jgi:hypothetical protein